MWVWSNGGVILTGENPKCLENTTLPTINPIRTGLGSNAGFRSERPPEPWHGLDASGNLDYVSCDVKGAVSICRL
jgi:hypothetical protein